MNTSEILSLITLIATVIIAVTGGIFALVQWHKSSKVRKAQFIESLVEKLRLNKDVSTAMYTIDYDDHWYGKKFHNSGNLERIIDSLFSCLDYICYLFNNKVINDEELIIFKYKLTRTCTNPQSQAYLWNLYHFSKINKVPCSYVNLINYLKKEIFDENQRIKFEKHTEGESGYKDVLDIKEGYESYSLNNCYNTLIVKPFDCDKQ